MPHSLPPADLDVINAKHASAREIALALGVPPMLLGIPGDTTFSNYQEANCNFWRTTVIPESVTPTLPGGRRGCGASAATSRVPAEKICRLRTSRPAGRVGQAHSWWRQPAASLE